MRKWEIHGTPIESVKPHDVGIVLGGYSMYNSDVKRLTIGNNGDRIWQAVTLYKSGKIKKILISGDNGFVSARDLHEASQTKEVLISWGIPEKDIISEEKSRNTHENAVETNKILQQSYPHINSFLLITSAGHMKRSLACFEKVGMHCTPFSCDLETGPKRAYYWDQYIIPHTYNFTLWDDLIKELVGYLSYRLVGYI